METKDLSIVIPVYNEEIVIANTVQKIINFMNKTLKLSYEIVLVNDGSNDNTEEVCYDLKDSFTQVQFIDCEENHGKGFAISLGVWKCHGKRVLITDADLSTPIEELPRFLSVNSDLVIASRNLSNSKVTYHKHERSLLHSLSSRFISKFLGVKVSDSQCGFKLIKLNVLKEFCKYRKMNGYVYDAELLYFASLNGYTITEVGITWIEENKSSVSVIKDSFKFLVSLCEIKFRKRFYLVERR